MNGYELSRNWFDWCFENPEKITPTHTAMYFFIIEHCNRLGWKEKFGLPMEMTKDAIGIKNYKTYSKVFDNLVEWNFIKVVQKSKNQYSATIIALVKNTKANAKALSKATLKHSQKQVQDIVCIDKPINNEPDNQEHLSPIGGATEINSLENDYKNLEKTTEPIVNFIKNNKPEFIEPYFDCWNLFAEKYKLAKIISITSKRKKKFNIRIKETDFNFIEILKKAGKSEFITTNGKWFGFDWLLENESNYLKVLEGNYEGKEIDAENKPENSKQMTYEEYQAELKKLAE